jgi:CheY-like chemotaxis protein
VAGIEPMVRRTLGEDIDLGMLAAADCVAVADPAQLESAVLNLCINARDAMPHGGKLTVEAKVVEIDETFVRTHLDLSPGRYVLVAVTDTGEGMSADTLAHAFEPFFTTKPVGQGTGLGLSMVYGFAKQSGGHVSLYSELGFGTTVKLYLPAASDEHAPVVAGPAEAPSRGAGHILVVEDDDLVRGHVSRQLRSLGYRVTAAEHGPAGLEILAADASIDLLFTDVVMPRGMNGRQLADHARLLRPGLRVLYTSGYTEDAIVHSGRLDRGVRLLNKPYRKADLALRVREALEA